MSQSQNGYRKITTKEAERLIEQEPDHVLVDVRSPQEYAEGHAQGAISLPVDTIAQEAPDKLPDKEQLILLCCRSGMRSGRAAQELSKLGYQNLCAFGGVDELMADERKGNA